MNIGGISMSRPFLAANLALVGLALFLGVLLARELARPPRVPAQTTPPSRAGAQVSPNAAPNAERLDTYNVIPAKHLFNPARAENAPVAAAAPAAAPVAKPVLHGVIVDGAASAAYLEDPTTKRVLVYHVGDSVGGGRLVQIGDDHVSIARPDARIEVLLKDPLKPQAAAPAGQPSGAPRARGGFVNPPTAQPPGPAPGTQQPPRMPRPLQGAPDPSAGTPAPPTQAEE